MSGQTGSSPAGNSSSAAAAGSVRASRRRFSTRGPKGKRGTVIAFRLRGPATVVFTVRGPSPNCGVAGKKSVRGHSGVNRVRLNGRFGDHTLTPGTYEIVVTARRGKAHKRVGRISIQVVPPGSRVRRHGSAPAFQCSPGFTTLIAATGITGAGFGSGTGANDDGGAAQQRATSGSDKTPGRSGVLGEPPFHIGTGNGGIDMLLALLLYGTLGVGGAVLIIYLVRFLRSSERA
jgi:hypothetical protein